MYAWPEEDQRGPDAVPCIDTAETPQPSERPRGSASRRDAWPWCVSVPSLRSVTGN